MCDEPVLQARDVSKVYAGGVRAVDGVSLGLAAGECLGLVGESGSGKSTLARCLLGVERITGGEIIRRGSMQVVFQNAPASFNSRLPIIASLLEPLDCKPRLRRQLLAGTVGGRRSYAAGLMRQVGLDAELLHRLPGQLSGGQLQRVSIARALSTRPDVVVLDEPTASLDVSIQARTLNLLKDLRDELGVAYLFITHDLGAARFMSERIIVMQHGRFVDECRAAELLSAERDPYTKQLVALFQ